MGCDIHTTMQVRRDGLWHYATEFARPDGYIELAGGYKTEFLKSRNYALFGILAAVRSEVSAPLAAHRGLPEGLTDDELEFHDGNHSATHFTLAEVLAYDWTQTLDRQGIVDPFEYAEFKIMGKPNGWCGRVGGGGVLSVDIATMERLILRADPGRGEGKKAYPFHDLRYAHGSDKQAAGDRIRALAGGSPYTLVQWQQPYYEVAGDMFESAVPRALRLGAPEDVRFVISFDS